MLDRKKGETFKQYVERAKYVASNLNDVIFHYKKMCEEIQNSKNVVHIDELKKRDDRILKLVNRLKDLGLYCGE